MVSFSQRFLIVSGLCGLVLARVCVAEDGGVAHSSPVRFRSDDPLWVEPHPHAISSAKVRSIDPLYDFISNSFVSQKKSDQARNRGVSPRQRALNTVDEVPDSAWYTNRRGRQPISRESLLRGPGNLTSPLKGGAWRVIGAKSDGVTPGFQIEDAHGARYLLKFDPPRYPELASAADVIGSKAFYALGYWTPENYIVRFERRQLTADPKATYRNASGHKQRLTDRHLDALLRGQPRDGAGTYRAMASKILPGTVLGSFRYEGTRSDDPNDLIAHEDRRDLRALAVMAAWLNHTDAKSINTLDVLVEDDQGRFIRHYLIDFGASLGSDSFAPKDPRLGHEYFIDVKPTLRQISTLGLYLPRWSRVRYPEQPAIGHFSSDGFEPEKWKPNYPNPAFSRLQPDDAFWAAKQIVTFSDDDIRALVSTGEYSDPKVADYVARALMARRDAIGKAYLTRLLPLDRFEVDQEQLKFADLAGEHNLAPSKPYDVSWALYDNQTQSATAIPGASGPALPAPVQAVAPGHYASATLRYAQTSKAKESVATTVYLRKDQQKWTVVGVERHS